MIVELILFLTSFLPVGILGFFIYKRDRIKEPIDLILKLFVGGILSCFLVFIVSFVLGLLFPVLSSEPEELNLFELIVFVFLGIAFVEEICKWLISYKMAYNEIEFEELYDMIVYSVFVSLGFAFFENLLYIYDTGILTGVLRAITAVPAHACFGVFMGYYLGLAKSSHLSKNSKLETKYILYSIIVPIILHGIYDYCLFAENVFFMLIFFVFTILIYIFSIKKVNTVSLMRKKIKYTENYCPNCGIKIESNFCPYCGRKNN